MSKRLLKYQKYLDKYKNCPPQNFIERDFECFRWVHDKPTEKNFLPIPFIRPVMQRQLDDNDKGCIYYALSVYKDLKSARNAYKYRCSKFRTEDLEMKFRDAIGEYAAKLQIEKADGISNAPDNRTGHISFYEYTDCKLLDKIKGRFDIFA